MIRKLSDWLARNAKGWLILALFAGEVAFIGFVMSAAQAKLEAFSGGTGPIDLMFAPAPEKVLAAIDAYGAEGRAYYGMIELSADIIYPIIYTLFYSLLITYLLQRGLDQDSKLQQLNLLPFGAWVCDLLENVGILALIFTFPAQSVPMAGALTVINGVKWLFAGSSILTALLGLGAWVFKKIKAG